MLRKAILMLSAVVLVNLVLFIIANMRRAISLDTSFHWLLAILIIAVPTMVIMAVDSERSWNRQLREASCKAKAS